MAKSVLMAVVLTLLCCETATAQVARSELTLAMVQLQRAVDGLGPARPARLVEAVQWLQRRAATSDPTQVSVAYLRTLTNAATLLGATPTPAVIEDIADDLDAKVEHCRTLGIGMGGSVLLRVNTRRGSQTVNDWQVFYLLKIYEGRSSTAPATFATLSTPAETRLEPGRYWIWARDPTTGRTSDRALLKVAGKPEFRVDLPVP